MARRKPRVLLETPEQQIALREIERGLAATRPAEPDTVIVARRRLQLGNQIFDRGVVIPAKACGGNYRQLLDSHAIERIPTHLAGAGKPRAIAVPAAEKPNPPVQIISDADTVQSWKKTYAAMTAACGGNAAKARDLLMVNEAASKLYRLAVRVDAERTARAKSMNARRVHAL